MKTLLEKEILEIINCATCSEYIGELEVLTEKNPCDYKCCTFNTCQKEKCKRYIPDTYVLKLYLNRNYTPMVFSYQGTEQEFKDYIKEEMKSRKLQKIFRYEVIRDIILPGDEREDE